MLLSWIHLCAADERGMPADEIRLPLPRAHLVVPLVLPQMRLLPFWGAKIITVTRAEVSAYEFVRVANPLGLVRH